MKKSICWVLSFLLLFCLVGCKKENNKKESKEEKISWVDYIPAPFANVTHVHFVKPGYINGVESWDWADNNPTEATAFKIDTMCPNCKSKGGYILDFKDLPKDKLGNETIVVKKSFQCYDCSRNYATSFRGDYDGIVQLTLAKHVVQLD